jgi:hypothetical protein
MVTSLQIRYHPNFKGRDTLLFAGSQNDIDLLRSFFFGWNGDELDLIAYLQTRGKVYLFSISALRLRRDTKRDSFVWSRDRGTWLISETYQQQIIDLLDGLLAAQTKGHQYLEPGSARVQVVVSKDEDYPLLSAENSGSKPGGPCQDVPFLAQ